MKLKCVYSGLPFEVTHFPGTITGRYTYHPIFDIPQKELLQYTRKWSAGELTETDSYLYYLALLNSTELIVWRTAACHSTHTQSVIQRNMESLIRCIGRINLIKHPSFVLHKIAIQAESCDLLNSGHWISNWTDSYHSFIKGYKDEIAHDKIVFRERALERMIKDANKPVTHYVRSIANWAAMVGEFPVSPVRVGNKVLSLSDYWKEIIVACSDADKIFNILEADLDELIEYSIDNVDAGSIFGKLYFDLLKSGKHKQKFYLGDEGVTFDNDHPGFKILNQNESVEQANILALIAAAPKEPPLRTSYGTLLAYLRDKQRYQEAQKYMAQQVIVAKVSESLEKNIDELDDSGEIPEDSMQDAIEDELILPTVYNDEECDDDEI